MLGSCHRVSAGLDNVTVLQTMVEQRVQPLKQWVHLLCDYTRVDDLTCEAMEELEHDVVIECMARMVSAGVIVVSKSAVVVFSVSHRPDLVSHPFSCPFFYSGSKSVD